MDSGDEEFTKPQPKKYQRISAKVNLIMILD